MFHLLILLLLWSCPLNPFPHKHTSVLLSSRSDRPPSQNRPRDSYTLLQPIPPIAHCFTAWGIVRFLVSRSLRLNNGTFMRPGHHVRLTNARRKKGALSFLPQRKMPLSKPFFKHDKAINKHSTGYVKPPSNVKKPSVTLHLFSHALQFLFLMTSFLFMSLNPTDQLCWLGFTMLVKFSDFCLLTLEFQDCMWNALLYEMIANNWRVM